MESISIPLIRNAIKALNNEESEQDLFELRRQNGKHALFRRHTNVSGWGTKKHVFAVVDAIRSIKLDEALESLRR